MRKCAALNALAHPPAVAITLLSAQKQQRFIFQLACRQKSNNKLCTEILAAANCVQCSVLLHCYYFIFLRNYPLLYYLYVLVYYYYLVIKFVGTTLNTLFSKPANSVNDLDRLSKNYCCYIYVSLLLFLNKYCNSNL